MILLIDLSNNNSSPIDFAALRKDGVWGVWHKVSEGTNFADPFWLARAKAARDVGLHVGGYHFARPGHGSAQAEADSFCSHLQKVGRRDLHPVLDLEDDGHLGPDELHAFGRNFLSYVHTKTGVRCLVYMSPGFVKARNWQRTFGTGAGLWLADYGVDDGHDHGPHVPEPWRQIVAHQYTSKGIRHGVNGYLDLTHARARRKVLAHGLLGIR